MRLSGTTLKVMGWLEPPLEGEGADGLHDLWSDSLAAEHSQGRGFYRVVKCRFPKRWPRQVEATMRALDKAMDELQENSPEFKSLFKDRERLLEELIELEEGDN